MQKPSESVQCPKCKVIIRPPFMACSQNHITCRKCIQHLNLVTAEAAESTHCSKELFELTIFNKSFESVFDICQHGCSYRDNLLKLGQHELKYHQQGPYSACAISSCDWTGNLRDLIHHVWYKHGSKFMDLSNEDAIFHIDVNSKISLVTQFYRENYTNEVYWIRIVQQEDRRYVLMMHEGRIGAPDDGIDERIKEFTVSSVNHQEQAISSKTLLQGGDISDKAFVIDKGTDITSLEGNSFIINIKKEVPEIPEMILNMLKCTICTEMMTPPIRQCESGHSCCESCGRKSKICPKCSKKITCVRNIALEEMRESFAVACRKECFAVGTKERMEQHIQKCDHKITKCARNFCATNWEGPYNKYLKHLNTCHHDVIKQNGSSFTCRLWTDYLYYIEGHYFIFKRTSNTDSYVVSVYEITDENCSEFSYSAEFSNRVTKETVTFTRRCLAATATNLQSDNCPATFESIVINKKWFDTNFLDEYDQFIKRLLIFRDGSEEDGDSCSTT